MRVPAHDAVIRELEHRFDTTGMKEIFAGLDAMNPKDTFATFNVDHIMTFAEQCEGDFKIKASKVARENLKNELQQWHKWVQSPSNPHREEIKNLSTVCEVVKFMVEANLSTSLFAKKVFLLYERAAVLPVTSTEIERSFSSMSFIKNYLRNRMKDERLSDLLLLYKSSNMIANKLDLAKAVKAWHFSQKDRGITLY